MKNFKLSIAWLAVFALIFTSCSKEEVGGADLDSDKATLSFGAIVNDLVQNRAATKQAIGDMPDCDDDATADYVEIVLVRVNDDNSTTNVVGNEDDPYRIDLVNGQLFTEEDPALELTPGDYRLTHFSVYDEMDGDDVLIWIAPRTGSPLGQFVENALPMDIDLRAGVKKYVDVSVLCFDNRNVNQYGYLFFEFDTTEAIEFCFFANYCPTDEGGRDYPARYSVTIWSGTNANGTPIYTDVVNTTNQYDNGDYYALPLCFALPDNDNANQPYLYYEVTLLDWPANYGDAEDMVISGTLRAQDIYDNFDGDDNVNYEHLRFGCEGDSDGDDGDGDDGDGDNGDGDNGDGDDGDGDDGDGDNGDGDNGDGDDGNGDGDGNGGNNGCETAYMKGDIALNSLDYPGNNWGWAEHFANEANGEYTYPIWAGAGQNETSRGDHVGNAVLTADGNDFTLVVTYFDWVDVNDLHVYIGDTAPESRAPGQFDNQNNSMTYTRTDNDRNFWFIVHAEVCYDDDDSEE